MLSIHAVVNLAFFSGALLAVFPLSKLMRRFFRSRASSVSESVTSVDVLRKGSNSLLCEIISYDAESRAREIVSDAERKAQDMVDSAKKNVREMVENCLERVTGSV